ncbi:MAG TPA: BofC C-terminal domain-containing protein [Bacillales bacterium]|nr:BofC C-terminal domain-containing protein [Bacillales bacterium]
MKRLTTIFVMLLFSAAYILGFHVIESPKAQKQAGKGKIQEQQQDAYQVTGPKTVNVYLKRVFLDGRTSVDKKEVTIWSMEDFWSRFSNWQLVDQNTSRVVFKKKVNDISPVLKASGYFGLSKDDILTIYKGKPEKKEAIHSFFHIDVEELESELQSELRKGIPVRTKGHYKKVIKRLKEYSAKEQ